MHLEVVLKKAFPDHVVWVKIGFPDSPNPLCHFEIDGTYFAQGSFWANNEYEIGAIDPQEAIEVFSSAGSACTVTDAINVVGSFCAKLASNRKPAV